MQGTNSQARIPQTTHNASALVPVGPREMVTLVAEYLQWRQQKKLYRASKKPNVANAIKTDFFVQAVGKEYKLALNANAHQFENNLFTNEKKPTWLTWKELRQFTRTNNILNSTITGLGNPTLNARIISYLESKEPTAEQTRDIQLFCDTFPLDTAHMLSNLIQDKNIHGIKILLFFSAGLSTGSLYYLDPANAKPKYIDQHQVVGEILDAHNDIIKNILRIGVRNYGVENIPRSNINYIEALFQYFKYNPQRQEKLLVALREYIDEIRAVIRCLRQNNKFVIGPQVAIDHTKQYLAVPIREICYGNSGLFKTIILAIVICLCLGTYKHALTFALLNIFLVVARDRRVEDLPKALQNYLHSLSSAVTSDMAVSTLIEHFRKLKKELEKTYNKLNNKEDAKHTATATTSITAAIDHTIWVSDASADTKQPQSSVTINMPVAATTATPSAAPKAKMA